MSASLLRNAVVSVSSVLNRDSRQYGKKCLLDGNSDTCWNSDQGTPQWIHVDFTREVFPKELQIQFQGGFAGKDCYIEGQAQNEIELIKLSNFYPEDINALQIFKIDLDISLKSMRIVFNNSSDFFGRVVVYHLEILGEFG